MASKPFAKAHFIRRDEVGTLFKRPRAASQPYEPGAICAAYGFPTGIAVTSQRIVIGELGGAFYSADTVPWASKAGLAPPVVNTYSLPGSDLSSGDADAEVALDWQMAAAIWSYMTGTSANILLVYGPNSGTAFSQVMTYCNSLSNVGAGSWSWGSPEDQWLASDRSLLDNAASSATYPWCAASGDNDADDGESAPVTDYPAASPYIIGCGGTSRPPSGPETVWNNGNGEGTGGGLSKIYSQPSWQPANSQGSGRMVPDIAMNGDPDTGYNTMINNNWQVIGGTSAVAPMMAGFLAVVNGARLKLGMSKIGLSNALLWSLTNCFLDITSGNNGTYNAVAGPDPCSGIGRPLGMLFQALLGGNTPIPPIPPIPPVPIPTTPLFYLTVNKAVPVGGVVEFRATKAIPVGKYPFGPAVANTNEIEVIVR